MSTQTSFNMQSLQAALPVPPGVGQMSINSIPGLNSQPLPVSAKPRKQSQDGQCPNCSKAFKQETLNKYGGICGKCSKKATDGDAPKPKFACPGCNKEYAKSTLARYGGICGTCNKARGVAVTPLPPGGGGQLVMNPVAPAAEGKPKNPCPGGCGGSYTAETYRRNGGTCSKCKGKVLSGVVTPPAPAPTNIMPIQVNKSFSNVAPVLPTPVNKILPTVTNISLTLPKPALNPILPGVKPLPPNIPGKIMPTTLPPPIPQSLPDDPEDLDAGTASDE